MINQNKLEKTTYKIPDWIPKTYIAGALIELGLTIGVLSSPSPYRMHPIIDEYKILGYQKKEIKKKVKKLENLEEKYPEPSLKNKIASSHEKINNLERNIEKITKTKIWKDYFQSQQKKAFWWTIAYGLYLMPLLSLINKKSSI
jgi:hypothetical protein